MVKLPLQTQPSLLSQPITSSSLLLMLPVELRSETYALALGGQRFHLTYRRKDLHHVITSCLDQTDESRRQRDFAEQWWRQNLGGGNLPRSGTTDIALLQTCQQIYREAIEYLHSSNLFNIHQGDRWPFLSSRGRPNPLFLARFPPLPPPYLCRIRRLEVDWLFKKLPTKDEMLKEGAGQIRFRSINWATHWQTIGKEMPGLRVLFVRIDVQDSFRWTVGQEMHWAGPMLKMGNLDACKVFLILKSYIVRTREAAILLKDFGDGMCTPHVSICVQNPLDTCPVEFKPWNKA